MVGSFRLEAMCNIYRPKGYPNKRQADGHRRVGLHCSNSVSIFMNGGQESFLSIGKCHFLAHVLQYRIQRILPSMDLPQADETLASSCFFRTKVKFEPWRWKPRSLVYWNPSYVTLPWEAYIESALLVFNVDQELVHYLETNQGNQVQTPECPPASWIWFEQMINFLTPLWYQSE